MIGWRVTVHVPPAGGPIPPVFTYGLGGDFLAAWGAELCGLEWLDELVAKNQVLNLGGNGYPYLYAAQSKYVKDILLGGVPLVRWSSSLYVNRERLSSYPPDDWLIFEVFDES